MDTEQKNYKQTFTTKLGILQLIENIDVIFNASITIIAREVETYPIFQGCQLDHEKCQFAIIKVANLTAT